MRAFFVSGNRRFAPIVALIVAAVSVSCSDALFGRRAETGFASIAIAPQFTRENATIYRSLKDFALQVNNFRVVLKRATTTDTLKDTTVVVNPGDTAVVVEMQVPIKPPQELLTAVLEIRSGDILVFSGSINIVAEGGANLANPPALVPVYVGPGNQATRVRISPQDTTIRANANIPMSAAAFDAANAAVTDAEFVSRFEWTVLEPTLGSVTVPASGPTTNVSFTGSGTRGTARVMVRTPNLKADTVSLMLVPAPSQLSTISGNGQTDTAGKALAVPFVVEVRAADNLPVPNTLVKFAATAGGGSVAPDSAFTDAQGRAQTVMTLGFGSTSQSFRASVTGLTAQTVTATAVFPDVATTIAFAQGLQIVDQGSTVTAGATVKSQLGNPMPNEPVSYLSRSTGIATVSASGVITGVARGQAIIVASVTNNASIMDSLLAVVAAPNGPVVLTSLERMRLPLDTTFTVSVYADMRTSPKKLGSTLIDVEWSTAQMTYQSHANGAQVAPEVNSSTAGTGKLTLAMADATGFAGKVELLRITFRTTTTGATGTLKLTTKELNAADPPAYSDLLPVTTSVTHLLRTP